MPEKLRVLGKDGQWIEYDYVDRGKGEVYVPRLCGTWLIAASGMYGNVGGNDPFIYTVHPDDCARIAQGEDHA